MGGEAVFARAFDFHDELGEHFSPVPGFAHSRAGHQEGFIVEVIDAGSGTPKAGFALLDAVIIAAADNPGGEGFEAFLTPLGDGRSGWAAGEEIDHLHLAIGHFRVAGHNGALGAERLELGTRGLRADVAGWYSPNHF